MDFNFASFIDSTIGLFGFMSRAYGTGNIAFDGFLVGFFCLVVVFIVSLMQMAGYNRNNSGGGTSRDVALLEDVAELLNELNLQVTEMHGSVVHEFHRCRGELGAIRQDMVDLKTSIQTRPPSNAGTYANSSPSTSSSKRPTFYGGKRGDLSGLRGFSN